MTSLAFLFFALFALVQFAIYIGIRREWLTPAVIAGGGVVLSTVFALLMSLAQGNSVGQAVFVGVLFGLLITGITLAAAWYFHRSSMQQSAT
jgi:chromate transport protein ChrA